MTGPLHRDVQAAIRDAGVTPDARGLMPIADARALALGLQVFRKDASDETNVLGADTAWAALLSLADADEFLATAFRIRWNFHVRGRENLAAHARYGDAILPWIAAAVDARGTLRAVPWCLEPCLMAIGTPEALTLALAIQAVVTGLDAPDDDAPVSGAASDDASATPSSDAPTLGLAPRWLGAAMAERLPLVLAAAADDPRAAALLTATIADVGAPAVDMLAAALGGADRAASVLAAHGIAPPEPDPAIEAALLGVARAPIAPGPPWSVRELDRDEMFPYWDVLDGYATPYAVRVSAFADPAGDVLVVQRFGRDQRGSEPGFREVTLYGPGASRIASRPPYERLIEEEDVAGVHLKLGSHYQGYVDGLLEIVSVWGDADARGVPLPDVHATHQVRNPMPLAEALIRIAGRSEDIALPPGLPPAWQAVALDAAAGNPALAETLLRSIDAGEGLLLRLAADYREDLFLGADALRALVGLSDEGELLFELDDPELPETFMGRPASVTPPWPLICEALRRRARIDPTKIIPRVDVLRRRLLWTEGRGGAADNWAPEMHPCDATTARASASPLGASPHANELLQRGWPHGVRLLHQHPHNDNPALVLEWILAQPTLPLRSYWAREVALRFVRHVGGDASARDHAGWIYPAEARVLVQTMLARGAPAHGPLASEVAILLLEAFLGAPALLAVVHDALAALPAPMRTAPHPDGFSALLALGWVLRRAVSPEAAAARRALLALASSFPRDADLGRALDLILGGADGAHRSARTQSEWFFAGDPQLVAAAIATLPAIELPLDLQFAVALGDEAILRWEQQTIADADKDWFASELDLLASPRAAQLAARLR